MHSLILQNLVSTCTLAAGAATSGSLLLPQGSGQFAVSMESAEIVDHSRVDPWNASHPRRLMISKFDPIPKEECHTQIQVPYMTPNTVQVESETWTPRGYPADLWSRFELEFCARSKDMYKSCQYPVALFGPALNTTRLLYSSLAQEVASHGITIITVDHPYDVDVVEYPNGDVVRGCLVEVPKSVNDTNTASFVRALDIRADDLSFVIDYFQLNQVVAFGHSFGGAASATAMRKDPRILGGVNLDGAMVGPVVDSGFDNTEKQSYIVWGSTGHNTRSPYNTDSGLGEFWDAISQEPNVWKREFTVNGTKHGAYCDLNLCVDVAGLREQPRGGPDIGSVSGKRIWQILGTWLPVYFRFALGIAPESDILSDIPIDFPEVSILRR